MFVKDTNGGYINADQITGAYAEYDSTNYRIKVSVVGETTDVYLSGTWASQAAAQEAIRELFGGVDPATYGD